MSEILRILVVEDNSADTDFIQEMLLAGGSVSFQAESVVRLSEALTRLESKDIDLVLLDLGLPDSQGLQTFHKLQEAAPGVPVVVLTGTNDNETAVRAVRDGAQDYLVKGQIQGHMLVLAARYALERKKVAEAIIASEVRYRRLFETAQDGILILDAETGMVEDVNPFLIELLGYSREEFLGKKVWELGFFKDIIANQDHFAELQQQEYIRYADKPLETADGRKVDVEFVSNVYLVNQHKVIQCNIRSIIARKQAGARIAQQLDELRRWHQATLGREGRLLEVKQEVNELLARLGEPPRYPSALAEAGAVASDPRAVPATNGPSETADQNPRPATADR